MSIVFTADVFCDGDDCSQWTHGALKHETPPTKRSARAGAAKTAKWKRIDGKDYCPRCWSKLGKEESCHTTT